MSDSAISMRLKLLLAQHNEGTVTPLKRAGYVSPQGVPFKCSTCDWFRRWAREPEGRTGFCAQPDIRRTVEVAGCCNYWAHEGVTG